MYLDPASGNFDDEGLETAVAIVGMSARFAQARGLDAYWSLLNEGREAYTLYSEEELIAAGVSPALVKKDNYVRSGAPIEDMECFDAGLFGLSPRDAAIMDPQHRHFLECTWEALENAGHTPQGFEGVIGVFAGSGHNAYMPYNLMTNSKLVKDVGLFLLRHTSNDKDFMTTRVSYLFDLKGPSINIQTACSTSLVSMHMAAQSLLNGECDMALAGGSSIGLPHRQGYVYEEGEILSPDGHCRPFDVNSQGTVFGSGTGIVVLRRLADAINDGDHIHAVLRGSAINNDGAGKVGYLAPSVDGQAKVIAEALAIAGVDADTIGYVEAHGTGTPVGDPIEVAALTSAYRQTTDASGYCGIGSVKGNIGHTDTAAGVAGVIKVALSMQNDALPATLGFTANNPSCALETSPFVVQGARAAWPRTPGKPRRAGVSSLGVGGTNAHVVLEEAPLRARSGPSRRRQLLLLSARSDTALANNASALAGHLEAQPTIDLADAAYTLQAGRQGLTKRHYVVAGSPTEAVTALAATPANIKAVPGRDVSFLFCGAGPQHIDMARDLYDTEPSFKASIDKALAILDRIGVPNVGRWMFPVEADRAQAAEELARPSIALPALFAVQTALADLWMSIGVQPKAMIGHSSGEYAAAYVAGVIDLEAGLRIVSARGRLFEKTAPGGMLSVPMTEDDLQPLLPADLSIATINAPRLCVVSGPAESIAKFHQQLESQEIEAQVVRIAVAAHSVMLDPILPEFRAVMQSITLKAPQIPFASNLTGDWVSAKDVTDPEYWVRHLRETVRFTDGLKLLLADPEAVLLEVGPGRSMASLAKQHPDRDRQQPIVHSLPHPDQPVAHDAHWLEALGQLWAHGAAIDWKAFWGEQQRLKLPLPTYRFDRDRHWIDPGTLSAVANDDEGLDRRSDTTDWQFEPVWTRAAMPAAAAAEGTAMVLEDDTGLGARITERLRAEGRDVVVVRADSRFRRFAEDRFSIDPGSRCDYGRVFDALSAEERLPSQIFHCWLVSGEGNRKTRKLDHQFQVGLYSLAAMVPELARQTAGAQVEFALVSDSAQRVSQETAPMPAKAAAIGSARVISTEYPAVRIRSIDVTLPAADNARAQAALTGNLLSELAAPWEERPICYRGGERWVLEHQASEGAAPDAPIAPLAGKDQVFVITGGLGGLGLTIAGHVAQTPGAKIALIARSALPARDQWPDLLADGSADRGLQDKIRRVAALEASGAAVEVFPADVANTKAMKAAMRAITTKFGPIRGVFHTAGTLDDGLIETRTRSAMEAVLRPKVQGTLALEAALQGQPVDFLMLFSSVSALAGLPGQADYAAANAFLDAYAQARRDDPVTRVISVGWSQWREVGMAAHLSQQSGLSSDLPRDLGEGTEVDHPFLDRLHTLSLDEYVIAGTLSPETHWLLDEHRIEGAGALIPGTGYLELARAAHAMIDPQTAALSDVTFLAPFFVADGTARELRIHLRRRVGSDWRFVMLGRDLGSDAEWVEHASGTCCPQSLTRVPAPLDIAALRDSCPVIPARGNENSSVLRFGPRWDNMRRIAINRDEALIDLALDPAFAEECNTVLLHPALLDLATAGAQMLVPGYNPQTDFFAPFSYRWVVLHAPMPAQIVSHVRYRASSDTSGATATYDITIADTSGRVLAEISEFTMMRVADTGAMTKAGHPATGAPKAAQETMLDGILPEEGMSVIDQVLAGRDRSHVLVSPYDLNAAVTLLRTPRRAARAQGAGERDGDQANLPATAMEQAIAELWSDLLGVDPILRDDDFFDLGGHSLLAVQFVNRLRKKTGKTLPLAALLAEPTVAGLARELDPDSAPVDAGGVEAEAESIPSRDVVTIRAGGSNTPMFFVHDGLGETLLYRGLALRLDGARPIYGIEPLRTATGGFAHTGIKEMAANYIERIKTVQAEGPYLVAGLCAGGVISFEIAKQLQDKGDSVAFVGIIDAADVLLKKMPFYITRERLKRIRTLVHESELTVLLPALARKAANAVRWEISSRLEEARNRRTVKTIAEANLAPDTGAEPEASAISFLKLYEVAHIQHQPDGVLTSGDVVLFKAMQGNGEKDDIAYAAIYNDFALGWGRRVADEVTVVSVPGGHSSVLQEPNVGTLAKVFQEAVDCAVASVERESGMKIPNNYDAVLVEAAE